jgi:hypothetical protein
MWLCSLGMPVPALAQTNGAARPDSTVAAPAAPAETRSREERQARAAQADSARAAGTEVKTPWGEQPRFVMLRSLVVPGWGQAHNHAWFKAVGVATAEGLLISQLVHDRNELDRLNQAVLDAQAANDDAEAARLTNEYNATLDHYVGRQWWLGGVVAYALLDAYVDAHFKHFDIEFRTDPALPGGVPPAAQRLQLRWHF